MLEILKKPHPFIFNAYSILIPSIITFLTIVILAPFQFQDIGVNFRLISAFLLSIIVALSITTIVFGLKSLFPNTIVEEKWTVGKEFLLMLCVIFTIILLISIAFHIFLASNVSIVRIFLKTASITLAISIFPIIILVLFEQYKHKNLQLKRATTLTETLKNRNDKLLAENTTQVPYRLPLLIRSENNHVELQLNPQDLIYIKSDGNYVEVYYNNDHIVQKKVIRNRLKAMEATLPNTLFFRCHNRFLVNGNYIFKVEGNARNLILHLKGVSEPIPVSRAKVNATNTFLGNIIK